MCGIAGVFELSGTGWLTQHHATISMAMDRAMAHRGPDAAAQQLLNDNVMLLHRRLSILGLGEIGNQPMKSACGRFVVVYNGEIFNYRELAKRYGFLCETGTDTEVLLQGWRLKGLDFVSELDGFFAFAIWDEEAGKLTLVRDKTGVKPLYYHRVKTDDLDVLLFGSDERSVIHGGLEMGQKFELNQEYKSLFFDSGASDRASMVCKIGVDSVDSGKFPISNPQEERVLCELAPGDYMQISGNTNRELARGSWFKKSFLDWATLFEKSMVDWQEMVALEPHYQYVEGVFNQYEFENSTDREAYLLNSLLHLSIARRLRSDVPLGFAVSGGLDSAVLVAIAAKLLRITGGGIPQVFSVQSLGDENDESYWQKLVVDAVGGEWNVIETADLEWGILDEFIQKTGRPPVHWNNLAHYAMCKRVKASGVTVLFNGQGADELFAGYPHYFTQQLFREFTGIIPYRDRWPIKFSSALKQRLKHMIKRVIGGESAYPTSLAESLDKDYFGQRLNQLLRFEDRNGMACALESRNPFADDYYLYHWIMSYGSNNADGEEWNLEGELTATLWQGLSKGVLRRVALNLLPEELVKRSDKKGFTVAAEKLTQKCYSQWMLSIHKEIQELGLASNWQESSIQFIDETYKNKRYDHCFRLISWLKYCLYLQREQLIGFPSN